MPLHRRVVVSTTGLLLFAGACASAPGSGTTQLSARPSTTSGTRAVSAAQSDSMYAQAVAEHEGPRVAVSAEFSNASYGSTSRRVNAHVRLDDDAYVVVGQISPDGIVRIVFPEEPSDDGFLRGRQSYQTADFFAGFTDQYRYRAATSPYGRFGPATHDSYDAGFGYVFVIASWRPMRFDQFSTGGAWDSFELTDNEYLRDPRPAVYELAALLAGANREAYSVEFAHYTNTQYAFDGGGGGSSFFSNGFCSGFAPLGYASSPFGRISGFNSLLPYGESFLYRGRYYSYNAFGDCYTVGSPYSRFGYGGGYVVSQAPPIYRPRALDPGARNPITPQPPRARLAADAAKATDASSPGAKVSPIYRSRGLLTTDTPDPRRAAGSDPVTRTRPTIQDMVGKHFEGRDGVTRAQLAGDRARPTSDNPRISPRTESSRAEPRPESPRSESPRPESPRVSAPAPRSESPRSEAPRVERSSPPPARPPEVKPPGR